MEKGCFRRGMVTHEMGSSLAQVDPRPILDL
jgi:hypothetical protein